MMSILIYDPFAGISGDMNMAAMVDLGVPEEYIKETLESLGIPDWEISFTNEKRKGISAMRAHVLIDGISQDCTDNGKSNHSYAHNHEIGHTHSHEGNHSHNHEHSHEGSHSQRYEHGHEIGHTHSHEHGHEHSHEHRNIGDIEKILKHSSLSPQIRERAMKMFLSVAEAEAKVHGMPIEKVHFHEVGAVDSILDIVAAAAAVEYLKPEKILSFAPELGGGFVKCAHGRIPVPAPATAEILKDVPVKTGAVDFETTTPTGAAILKTLSDGFITKSSFTIRKTGYGAGSRDTEIPNVLRVFLADDISSAGADFNEETVYMMECNIDDMNPEIYGYVMSLLLEAGANDVYMTPVYMKKNRPGTLLSLVVTPDKREIMRDIIFKETTTAGIREYEIGRAVLERKSGFVSSVYGDIPVKKLFYKGEEVGCKAEYEAVRNLAEKHNIPMKTIYRSVNNGT